MWQLNLPPKHEMEHFAVATPIETEHVHAIGQITTYRYPGINFTAPGINIACVNDLT